MLRVAAILCLLCCTPLATAAPNPEQQPAKQNSLAQDSLAQEVARLVRQLDAGQRAEREAAEQGLVALGPRVLDKLPAITPRTSAEVKERLGRVRKVLELAAAKAAVESSRVTLSGKMTASEALAAIAKQTGNQLEGIDDHEVPVAVNFDNTPFWQALDEVMDQAGLTINIYGGRFHTLSLSARPDEQAPRVGTAEYGGLFRMEVTRLEAVRDLRNPEIQGMKVGLEVSWEPRLTPISIGQEPEELTVVDDQGNAIAVDEQQALYAPVESDISAVELVLPLELPPRQATKIGSLKGKISALLPGRTEAFEFSDLSRASDLEQRRAGVAVGIEQVRKNQELTEVRMHVRFEDAANALESHRGWVFNNLAYLLGPDDQKLEPASYQTTHQDAAEVGMAYLFDVPGDLQGYRFVYETPASILRTSVPFELKNIPLP